MRTPAEAYRCFRAAGLDLLVLGRCVVRAGAPVAGPELVAAELR